MVKVEVGQRYMRTKSMAYLEAGEIATVIAAPALFGPFLAGPDWSTEIPPDILVSGDWLLLPADYSAAVAA